VLGSRPKRLATGGDDQFESCERRELVFERAQQLELLNGVETCPEIAYVA
jgi:hypothetical protein